MEKIALSACIVAKNASATITNCLQSLHFAKEIVVVIDPTTTDNTIELAHQFTEKIYTKKYEGCGNQKQYAVSLCKEPWVLILDADEEISPQLASEITTTLSTTKNYAYLIPFVLFCCNKKIRFGSAFREKHLRLFLKEKATVIPRIVHSRIELTEQKIGALKNPILHYSFPNIASMLAKMNTYSTLSAIHEYNKNRNATIITAIWHGLFTFLRTYILKLGFLDGTLGFILAKYHAENSYYKYVKLSLMHKKSKTK